MCWGTTGNGLRIVAATRSTGADTAPGPEDCASRRWRGGSWHLVGGRQRGVFLSGSRVGSRDYAVGFRVVGAITDRSGLDVSVTDDSYTQLLFEAMNRIGTNRRGGRDKKFLIKATITEKLEPMNAPEAAASDRSSGKPK